MAVCTRQASFLGHRAEDFCLGTTPTNPGPFADCSANSFRLVDALAFADFFLGFQSIAQRVELLPFKLFLSIRLGIFPAIRCYSIYVCNFYLTPTKTPQSSGNRRERIRAIATKIEAHKPQLVANLSSRKEFWRTHCQGAPYSIVQSCSAMRNQLVREEEKRKKAMNKVIAKIRKGRAREARRAEPVAG
jgi:hypothetical protein